MCVGCMEETRKEGEFGGMIVGGRYLGYQGGLSTPMYPIVPMYGGQAQKPRPGPSLASQGENVPEKPLLTTPRIYSFPVQYLHHRHCCIFV